MIQKIKTLILSLSLVGIFAMPLAITVPVMATDQQNINSNLCSGANSLSTTGADTGGCDTLKSTNPGSTLDNDIKAVLNILSIIVGIIAVIMIIVGGFRYVTSGGKEESVKGAKNAILYAIIGLVIVALAQIIVRFVLSKTT